ncbi:MAG: hypothetical protein ABIZ05_01740 [Pseudonocardiaceae bacterium]
MTAQGFTVFATGIGHCGLAWGAHGVVGAQLPEGSDHQTRARMRRRFPEAPETEPPPAVRHVVDDIVELLDGRRPDLSTVKLDMTGVSDFHRKVYGFTPPRPTDPTPSQR